MLLLTSFPILTFHTVAKTKTFLLASASQWGYSRTLKQEQQLSFVSYVANSAAKTIEELRKAGTTPPIKKSAVYKWHKLFKNGRESIEDDTLSGRPSLITWTLVNTVRCFTEDDRCRSIQQISDHVGVLYGAVHSTEVKTQLRRYRFGDLPEILNGCEPYYQHSKQGMVQEHVQLLGRPTSEMYHCKWSVF